MQEHGDQILLLQQLQRQPAPPLLQSLPPLLDRRRRAPQRPRRRRPPEKQAPRWRSDQSSPRRVPRWCGGGGVAVGCGGGGRCSRRWVPGCFSDQAAAVRRRWSTVC
ncbi:unnamed protein product [Linum tenue]|uniref:Uncharacterized protein n=1 Tax=Linum tenue TaxID=586396 RepID=A0AAV0RN42_9ROSI|nr:unnamed protein product [Linum tenue]